MDHTKPAASIHEVMAFRDLSAASRSLLARGLRYVHYVKGAAVLAQGQRASGAFVVISGQLRVFTISSDGHEATLYLINAHETCVLALNCIFNDLLYPAWVEASSASRVALISGAAFKTLFDAEPAIRNMTVQAFSTLVFRLMSELEDIHAHTLEQRLCNFLLLHASSDGTLRLTQQEIASHLGTSREVIARALGQLVAAGRVRTGRRQIVICDPVTLAASVRRGTRHATRAEAQLR